MARPSVRQRPARSAGHAPMRARWPVNGSRSRCVARQIVTTFTKSSSPFRPQDLTHSGLDLEPDRHHFCETKDFSGAAGQDQPQDITVELGPTKAAVHRQAATGRQAVGVHPPSDVLLVGLVVGALEEQRPARTISVLGQSSLDDLVPVIDLTTHDTRRQLDRHGKQCVSAPRTVSDTRQPIRETVSELRKRHRDDRSSRAPSSPPPPKSWLTSPGDAKGPDRRAWPGPFASVGTTSAGTTGLEPAPPLTPSARRMGHT